MPEKLTDRTIKPTPLMLEMFMGEDSYARLLSFEKQLQANYQLTKELKFPYGKRYGWGYKYSHKTRHLCYAFFDEGGFSLLVHFADKFIPEAEARLDQLLPKTQKLWTTRNEWGWLYCQILSDEELADIVKLLAIKVVPIS